MNLSRCGRNEPHFPERFATGQRRRAALDRGYALAESWLGGKQSLRLRSRQSTPGLRGGGGGGGRARKKPTWSSFLWGCSAFQYADDPAFSASPLIFPWAVACQLIFSFVLTNFSSSTILLSDESIYFRGPESLDRVDSVEFINSAQNFEILGEFLSSLARSLVFGAEVGSHCRGVALKTKGDAGSTWRR